MIEPRKLVFLMFTIDRKFLVINLVINRVIESKSNFRKLFFIFLRIALLSMFAVIVAFIKILGGQEKGSDELKKRT